MKMTVSMLRKLIREAVNEELGSKWNVGTTIRLRRNAASGSPLQGEIVEELSNGLLRVRWNGAGALDDESAVHPDWLDSHVDVIDPASAKLPWRKTVTR